jgi:opacity protein-like surface antigen
MKSRHLPFLGALLLARAAGAQPVQGPYVSVAGGANIAGDPLSANQTTKVYTNIGALSLVDVGWSWGNGLRTEIEGSYRSNAVSGLSTRRVTGDLEPLSNTTGTARTYAVMANVEYDLPIHAPTFPIQPYVGAGLGYARLDLGSVSGDGYTRFTVLPGNTYTGASTVSFGSAGAFAYQAMVGASMPLRILPGLTLVLEYRFFGTARLNVPINRVAANATSFANGVVPTVTTHNGFIERDNAILIGFRYTF